MFTGVGGFELGLSSCSQPLPKIKQNREGGNRTSDEQGTRVRSGLIPSLFTPIGFSEIDKYASELLKNKFPGIKNYGDATKIIPKELPDFDLLIGGFPCQAFSIAGKRKGFEDTRGTLFYDIARILKVKRPEYILLENVKGLLSHDRGRTFGTIIATLSELGYVVQWMVLNSKFFGVPQNRERVFIIGSLRGKSIPEILPIGESSREVIPQEQISNTLISGYHKIARGTTMIQMEETKGNSQGARIYSEEGISQSISSGGGGQGGKTGLYAMDLYNNKLHSDRTPALTEPHHNTLRIMDGKKVRRLTPIECERLQGFPDGWTEGFSDTQRYKMMGNAVTVPVIKAIAEKLI